ncbi:MAG: histidinol-phosphate transaminase [Pseudomonadota bacterium]
MATTSRRGFLLAAASASALTAGCAAPKTAAEAEALGAFPVLPGGTDLIGPAHGVARLHSNENPYGPAQSAIRMMDYASRKGAYYADRATNVLTGIIAEQHGVERTQIALSTGSAEALSAVAVLYGQQGNIVTPRLFFDATVMYANRLGLANIVRAPMDENLGIDYTALERIVDTETALVQVCNPNNPTGVLSDTGTLKSAVRRMAAKTTVVVDEAYMELTDNPEHHSCIDLIRAGHNVIVSRTFSKLYGMAGIRVGYTVSSAEAASKIRRAKMSWMAGTSLAAAIGCHDDVGFMTRSRNRIVEAREMVMSRLRALDLRALPSSGNFVYFNSGQDANTLQKRLAEQGVLIRGAYMDYTNWSRVSMGRIEDVERFCRALPKALNA